MLTIKKEDNTFEDYQTEFLKACDDKEQLQLLIKEVKAAAKIVCDPYFIVNEFGQSMQTIYDFDSHRFHVVSDLPMTKRYKQNRSYLQGNYISFGYGSNSKTKLMEQLEEMAKNAGDSQVYNEIDKMHGFDKLTKYLISNLKRTYVNKYQKIVLRHNQCDLTESFVVDTFCGTARADILTAMWNAKPTDVDHATTIYLSSLEKSTFKKRYDNRLPLNVNEDLMSPENIVKEIVCATCTQGLNGYCERINDAAFTLQIPDELNKIQMWIDKYFNEEKWDALTNNYAASSGLFDSAGLFKQFKKKNNKTEEVLFCVIANLLRINKNSNALLHFKIVDFDAFIQFCKDVNNFKWTVVSNKQVIRLHQILSRVVFEYLKSTDVQMNLAKYDTKIKQLMSVFKLDDTPLKVDDHKPCAVTDLTGFADSDALIDADALYHRIECTGKQFSKCLFNNLGLFSCEKLNLTILSILNFKLTDVTADKFSHFAHTIALMFDNTAEVLSTLNKMYASGNIVLKDDETEDVTLF